MWVYHDKPPYLHFLDGFDSTKPGPYFYAKQFQSQGKFGGVGGRMRTTHVLRKRHHHHKPAPQGKIVPFFTRALRLTKDKSLHRLILHRLIPHRLIHQAVAVHPHHLSRKLVKLRPKTSRTTPSTSAQSRLVLLHKPCTLTSTLDLLTSGSGPPNCPRALSAKLMRRTSKLHSTRPSLAHSRSSAALLGRSRMVMVRPLVETLVRTPSIWVD
jgi:hypothetical protein